MKRQKGFDLPAHFLLGAATAPAQIEGGAVDHSWMDWAEKGHIKDHTTPARATAHFTRWQEDIALMRDMGLQTYRLGVEWARLEPAEGRFDEAAAAGYRQILTALRDAGIRPLLTLHHFANPMWFERLGAFEKAENRRYFLRFVNYAVKSFGEWVSDYVTINEPNVYATNGYFFGIWPPGQQRMLKAFEVMNVMAACHIEAYEAIHTTRRTMGYTDTRVGFAHHMRVFAPRSAANPWHRLGATATKHLFQTAVTRAFLNGDFAFPLKKPFPIEKGEYADFLGLNYYTRSTVTGLNDGVRDGACINDLGWEIYPEGLVLCAREMHKILPRPLWVTENGTCDRADAFRARYIYEHLKAATESGLNIERYYHWCFCDNFEWLEGESARFGLVHTDFDTQRRQVKNSGAFYTQIINNHGVTEGMYDAYVAEQVYPT